MKSSVVVAKHPLHPMLIPLPIGAFTLTLVGDLAYAFTSNPFWYAFAAWSMGIGIASALLAALPGLVDYVTMVPRNAKRIATLHMGLNFGMVAIFGINLALRIFATATSGPTWWLALALTVVGVAALSVSGWLGGELVYRHRLAVEEPGEPGDGRFRITLSPEEAEPARRRKP